jgi:thiol-disulfide isomerase/thioredoxin
MIETMVLAARLLLAAVFIVAGVAKLLDPAGSRRALAGFRVPERLVSPLALALPLAECAIAIGLLAVATAWPAAIGALVLLVAFMTAVGLTLLRGRTPDCHCFGQLYSAPVGPSTLARIGALAAVAAFLVLTARATPGPGLFAGFVEPTWPEGLALGGVGSLLLLSAAQSVMIYQLMRQQGRLLLKLEGIESARQPAAAPAIAAKPKGKKTNTGLPIGASAPAFRLTALDEAVVSSDDLLAERKPLLLIFTNPKCGPCAALMPEITHWGLDPALPVRIVMVSEGTTAENLTKFPRHGEPLVLVQAAREVAEAYKVYGTPAAVVIRANGEIGSALALGADDIRELVADPLLTGGVIDDVAGARQPARTLSIGEPVASLSLRDREGHTVPLTRFAGTSTLLLFWNPQCGFCQHMLSDLQRWVTAPPAGAPALIIVSVGPEALADDMQLGVPVLTDAGSQVSAAFGANGTPMAVLLGPDNRVAAQVAAGAHAVFALAGGMVSETAA